MFRTTLRLAAAMLCVLPAMASAQKLSPGEIVSAAPADAWVTIAPSDLLVMNLAPDAQGAERRVVIQLVPAPFALGWVDNIRALAGAHWWDGTSINRVQDNYVVQWGDASEAKPLPSGIVAPAESGYTVARAQAGLPAVRGAVDSNSAAQRGEAAPAHGAAVLPDAYARGGAGFVAGWPVAMDGDRLWPVHCYATVGVGRNLSPDTGTGAELYAVVGHAPRHLDRNIAVVGRVIEGVEYLSSLPRGTGQLGFYTDAGQRILIRSVRLAPSLPRGALPQYQYLDTGSAAFAAYADARANRQDAFFNIPAGGADVCNIPVPVRRAP